MLAAAVGGLIASLGVIGGLVAFLFWQSKRAASASDARLKGEKQLSELKLDLAARKVEIADLTKALNEMTANRDRLEFTLDTVEDQRDALIKEALDDGDPRAVAHSIRDALKRLRPVSPEVPKVPAGTAD